MPILINKPVGYTSHDVVAIVRKKLQVKRVGHAGTLDPLADGLLIVLVGREETKLQSQYLTLPKEYVVDITFGFTSTTDDREGELTPVGDVNTVTLEKIQSVLPQFIGTIMQRPPIYSAIHHHGQRAYDLARAGKIQAEDLPLRQVTITDLHIEDWTPPVLRLRVNCSHGTYIRSLARDIGAALGVGGYATALRRTKIGDYNLEQAIEIMAL